MTQSGAVAAFALVAGMLVLTPGVGTAFLMSTVIAHGRRAGYLTAAGMVAGASIYALSAALGTAALLRAFPQSLRWIAIIGGAFIIWLGLKGIIRAVRRRRLPPAEIHAPPGRHTLVTTGIIIALGNAPLPLFYLVVIPQYIPPQTSRLGGALLLSALHLAMAGTWMATVVTLVGRLVDVLRRPRVLLVMQVLTGIVLILLGIASIASVYQAHSIPAARS
jgi:threonine/homoserine/homoserine lactone efflux protein